MRTPVAAETQLEIILERIDPYYQPFLAFQDITSVTQLLQFCRKLDAKRDLAKDHVPPPPKHKSLIPEGLLSSNIGLVVRCERSSEVTRIYTNHVTPLDASPIDIAVLGVCGEVPCPQSESVELLCQVSSAWFESYTPEVGTQCKACCTSPCRGLNPNYGGTPFCNSFFITTTVPVT
ncbi:hypothetical protein NQ318_007551 [Aromia moschata]|uniref:Uncharacterized protein n=1 Tax=Aromia moschata TaxID=1265417 RepID=A0AAV8YCV2_9CUCU|nr:hypothetical protein NQ318_007551 [Aromia moschata]